MLIFIVLMPIGQAGGLDLFLECFRRYDRTGRAGAHSGPFVGVVRTTVGDIDTSDAPSAANDTSDALSLYPRRQRYVSFPRVHSSSVLKLTQSSLHRRD